MQIQDKIFIAMEIFAILTDTDLMDNILLLC